MLTLYNTLTRKKELFTPITPGTVLFYHCGPTVYWTQHIGNLRGMTMGDLLVRTLRYLGYTVKHVRNYTDVGHLTSDADSGEDKMEKGVKREGVSPKEIADKYIGLFEEDTRAMNLMEPTFKPRATEYIGEMIDMVSQLLASGHAYLTDLAVYFDVGTFPSYTSLNRQKLADLLKGAGKADVEDPKKRHPSDFSLWFFKTGSHANALQTWPSPFQTPLVPDGAGFPGWHIECSAMSRALLGKTIDIHMGGVEHIPVHHTNEIAQSEAANGTPFVHYWLHNEHLLVNAGKMAKSQGTGFALSEIREKGIDPLALRYFFLSAQYRSQQNFTWEALGAAAKAINDLRSMVRGWRQGGRTSLSGEKLEKIDLYRHQFTAAIEQDLNIPAALAVVWDMAKSNIPSEDKYELIMDFDRVLGLDLSSAGEQVMHPAHVPEDVQRLVAKRQQLRQEKRFAESDELRGEIERLGFILEDAGNSTTVKPK